jgi:hypothetical protein
MIQELSNYFQYQNLLTMMIRDIFRSEKYDLGNFQDKNLALFEQNPSSIVEKSIV